MSELFQRIALSLQAPARIDEIRFYDHTIQLIRYDLLHLLYGGNKWFKLKYNISRAIQEHKKHIISFGGPFSNHLFSLAAICRDAGLSSVGIVRGEGHYANNETLDFCHDAGMEIIHLSKKEYDNRYDETFIKQLDQRYPDAFMIPDGGANADGIRGAAEMCKSLPEGVKHVFMACGTFTTLCGVLTALPAGVTLWAVPVLKAESWARSHVHKTLQEVFGNADAPMNSCRFLFNYHFGGYARTTPALQQLQNEWNQTYGLNLDAVYGAKLFFAVKDVFTQKLIKPNEPVAVIMCGRPLTSYSLHP